MNQKLDRIATLFLWILIISALLLIILLWNIGNYSNDMIENHNVVYSNFGYILFFLFFYSIYLSFFFIWLILLIITKQDIQIIWKIIQLILIFSLAILPTILLDILLIK